MAVVIKWIYLLNEVLVCLLLHYQSVRQSFFFFVRKMACLSLSGCEFKPSHRKGICGNACVDYLGSLDDSEYFCDYYLSVIEDFLSSTGTGCI